MADHPETSAAKGEPQRPASPPRPATNLPMPPEIGGPRGPEPTRYGDWEVKGRCSDF